ncbi:hypothetical protein GGR50DRAFT_291897 [Xylaria sp. CBS 124048]|nr:hypothetical protein GGR50DRAFT_291897 [Xylaria sp. CBS 124048]
MQLELLKTPQQSQQRSDSPSPQHADRYGPLHCDASGPRGPAQNPPRRQDPSMSMQSVSDADTLSPVDQDVFPDILEERLRRLSIHSQSPTKRPSLAGQRIFEYENALTHSVPRQALGFTVIKRTNNDTAARVNLDDFPNEILTHILSHLHPDSHASVALVSKRFYSLITTPHAWRMAFQRFFPAQEVLVSPSKPLGIAWGEDDDTARSQVRAFTRLTSHASWRSEYLLRTRLLRSLSRGKPGANSGVGVSLRASQSGKKPAAVLTYNTKVPSVITHVHAIFKTNGKKSPRVIHGASDLCVGSASDPTVGKVEKWGLDDPFTFARLDEVMPQLMPYGMGEGPAAMPNVMDVSQPYGLVGGEGFPGGRVFFRPTGEYRGKYLSQEASVVEAHPDIPKVPELSEGICSVWVAKSASVPTVTRSLVGIMTGSSLGVVTTYALGYDSSGPRYTPGEISARWVLSPGVPIIALRVDDSYSQKRRDMGRVWAVALNALGEVYYLCQPPTPPVTKTKADDSIKLAWHTGRSAYWHLVEATRRQARPDHSGKNVVRGSYSPKSPSNAMDLKRSQMIAEAREIERFFHYKPSHFRKVCYGWDMRRKLEVDFAGDDKLGAGESFFIIDCALDDEKTWALRRFTRTMSIEPQPNATSPEAPESSFEPATHESIFGGPSTTSTFPDPSSSTLLKQVASSEGKQSPPSVPKAPKGLDDWVETTFWSKEINNTTIMASAVDLSLMALITSFEDPQMDGPRPSASVPPSGFATQPEQPSLDIPGRMARLIGLGTNSGKVVLWNMRARHTGDGISPVRVIETDSPEVSCLALSALYLVHGGSDGLVQAWDPLASTLEPVRTLNSRSPGRMPRHLLALNPTITDANFTAVSAIYLDPDATILQGVVAFGSFVRYWAYSSSNQGHGRKRRFRHSEVHGRLSGRRHGGGVEGYIAAEAEELRIEQEHDAREQARLRARFGLGLNNLSEEEALQYAEMMSKESFLLEEQRRVSVSDTGSAADFDTASTTESVDTVTPEPSVANISPPTSSTSAAIEAISESEYELQLQTAIRLSLLEGVGDLGRSPKGNSSGDFDGPIAFTGKRGKQILSSAPSSSKHNDSSSKAVITSPPGGDDDLELALRLSLVEEQNRQTTTALESGDDEFPPLSGDGFPPLGGAGWGKGKGRAI